MAETGEALKHATAAALAGAAVGAARALDARRRSEPRSDGDEDSQQAEASDAERDEPEHREPEHGEPEESSDAERNEPEREQSPAEPSSDGAGEQPSPEPGRVGAIVRKAREQLRELQGSEPESVSSVTRAAGSWRVGLEVVEVHRIPESTDVLATYEVEVDEDGNLLGFERTRRYYRSEAERGGRG